MWLLTDVYLGVDSLVVSAAVASLVRGWSSRALLAALFGGCDALATVLGASLGWDLPDPIPKFLQVGAVCLYGVYIYLVARWGRHTVARWPIWLMPVLCSLDNLSYGIESHHTTSAIAGQAVMLGITSGILAALGLIAGGALAVHKSAPQPRAAGVMLLIAAAVLAVT